MSLSDRAATFYAKVYDLICGRHPHLRPWHFQWLAIKDVYRDLRQVLPTLEGRILDVGCGEKPYAVWLTKADEHIGIDISPGPKVDYVIQQAQRWPLECASFDAIVCTQVLEHVADLQHVLDEMHRVLKPNGQLVITVPFTYNEHGAPNDFRRLSRFGVESLFLSAYEITRQKTQGRVFGTVAVLILNWLFATAWCCRLLAIITSFLLPIWLLMCATVNLVAFLLDPLDRTQQFYANVMLVARKRLDA